MKKVYTKPSIAVESFQLDAAVAGTCADKGSLTILHGTENCGYGVPDPGSRLFGHQWQYYNWDNCSVDLTSPFGGDDNDRYCYHGPILTNGLTFLNS